VRQFLTSPESPVGVSFHAAAKVGVQTAGIDDVILDGGSDRTTGHASAPAGSVGGFGGIALDRQLIDRLTLRLAISLVSIECNKVTTSPSDSVVGARSSFAASLIFSPDLALWAPRAMPGGRLKSSLRSRRTAEVPC